VRELFGQENGGNAWSNLSKYQGGLSGLSSLLQGKGTTTGSTTEDSKQAMLNTILGGLMGGAGILGGTGAFGAAGWLPALFKGQGTT
jgi:lipoprotein signal peptidase